MFKAMVDLPAISTTEPVEGRVLSYKSLRLGVTRLDIQVSGTLYYHDVNVPEEALDAIKTAASVGAEFNKKRANMTTGGCSTLAWAWRRSGMSSAGSMERRRFLQLVMN